MASLGSESLGFATVDHHRQLRHGFPEVIFCRGRHRRRRRGSLPVAAAAGPFWRHGGQRALPRGKRRSATPSIMSRRGPSPRTRHNLHRRVAQNTGGIGRHSDMPVAEEAAVTARMCGNAVDTSRRGCGRTPQAALAIGPSAQGERDCRRRRNGRRAPERGRGPRGRAGHRGAHLHRIRRELRRCHRIAGDAQLLRERGHGSEHRQRLRRGICGERDQRTALGGASDPSPRDEPGFSAKQPITREYSNAD